ncbi:Predicted metal-dependent phosphoesterase TrpH, contains PHP domain [Desulfonatronum zhilinae]|nr:Predicted metal-dependent phosphoesterase TrpH, contains PHP domain [Desulfonatronum zhilinae]
MLRCAFHIHTIYSDDGLIRLEGLRDQAKNLGITTLCVTDHNSIEGALRFQNQFPELQTVVGEEIYTKQGEVIGLFLREFIPPGLRVVDTVQAIRSQGGLVCLPHPCDERRPSTLKREVLAEIASEIDIVEVFNSRTFSQEYNQKAQVLCDQTGRVPVWGSDAHYPEEVGNAVFSMDPFHDGASFLTALRNAQLVTRNLTTIPMRARLRLKRKWGVYGPLTLPERLFLAWQRNVFRLMKGGFVTIQAVDLMCQELAKRLNKSAFRPDVVVGIAGGGLYPAYRLAHLLEVPYDAMRISYPQVRVGNMDTDDMMGAIFVRNALKGNTPQLHAFHSFDCQNRRVLLVDDDCTSGRTLRIGLGLLQAEAREIKTLTLRILAKSDPSPDFYFEDRRGSVFRHARFPWIKYSPYYQTYARFRDRWLCPGS